MKTSLLRCFGVALPPALLMPVRAAAATGGAAGFAFLVAAVVVLAAPGAGLVGLARIGARLMR